MARTENFAVESMVDTLVALRNGADTYTVAAACREAALSFVNDAPYWGKAELAMWLLGSYSFAAVDVGDENAPTSRPTLREIDVRTVHDLIDRARAEVLDSLEQLRDGDGAANIAFKMISSGFVARSVDADGVAGWVPTTKARRLADRVLSLFVADCMMRPSDYEQTLSTCAVCERAGFDALARRREVCHRHGGVAATIPAGEHFAAA